MMGSRWWRSWLRTQRANAMGGRNESAMRMPRVAASTRWTNGLALMDLPSWTERLKRAPDGAPPVRWYVLDTSLLLGGKDPPRDGQWTTTREAEAEVSPGGRDARRFEDWRSLGLQVRGAEPATLAKVDAVAKAAGTLARLSPADRSLLALALELGATLVTDDYTALDVAKRLGVATQTVNQRGIEAPLDFRPRCTG